MLTTLVVLAIGYAAVRNVFEVKVRLKPHAIADTVAEAKSLTQGLRDDIRLHLMSKARRDQELIKRQAQLMYDSTVGEIFATATPEEQQTLLDLFANYGQLQS